MGAMLLDRQLEELLEGFSTSRQQARQLEVLLVRWLEELPVPVLPMLLPMESVTSSVEVARVEKEEREAREAKAKARERAREERVVRAFSEAKAKAKEERERAEAWISLSLKSASLVDSLELLAEASLGGL